MHSQDKKFKIIIGQGYVSTSDISKRSRSQSAECICQEDEKGHFKSKKLSPARRNLGFTKKSRNALIKALNDLVIPPTLFVTLTYPEKFKSDPAAWKRDLDNLRRRICEDFDQAWFFWRLEPHEKTGRPHFHLLGSTGDEVTDSDFWKWVLSRWRSILGVTSEESKFVTEVKEVTRTYEALSRYFSKEEKPSAYHGFATCWAGAGTRWGKICQKNFPDGPRQEFVISAAKYSMVRNIMIESIQNELSELIKKRDACSSFTPYKDAITLERSIERKKKHLFNVKHKSDYFSVIPREYSSLLLEVVTGDEAASVGETTMPSAVVE